MYHFKRVATLVAVSLLMGGCSVKNASMSQPTTSTSTKYVNYAERVPNQISPPGEKVIIVDPSKNVWAAYAADGDLLKAGLATTGALWCDDVNRPCRTAVGSFRINSLGSASCKSSRYPLPKGGAPMPYCMFFHGNQSIHGSAIVVDRNESHGCVRTSVADAEWIRFNFAQIGTKVVVKPYKTNISQEDNIQNE